jgi:hypothetical protein
MDVQTLTRVVAPDGKTITVTGKARTPRVKR